MKQILNYSLHDIFEFQIVWSKQHNITKVLNLPFSFFEVKEKMDDPDVILNIGNFTPSNEKCYVVDHKYHIKENYFYCEDSEGRMGWELEIFGFEEGDTIINFNGKFRGPEFLFSDLISQEMLLMPMIIYKLGKKGYYLIHAGGVSKEGSAYVFAGRGGSSKTELVIDSVKSGFDYLGDDWIIINKDKVLAFPKYFSEFIFSLKTGCLPTESSSTLVDKIRYLNYLRKNPSYNKNILKVDNPSTLKALFFIVKTNKKTIIKKNMSSKEAISRLIANNKIEMITSPSIMGKEFGRYLRYTLAYSFVFPKSKIARYWDGLEKNFEELLSKIPIYEIEIPQKYSSDVFFKRNILFLEDDE